MSRPLLNTAVSIRLGQVRADWANLISASCGNYDEGVARKSYD